MTVERIPFLIRDQRGHGARRAPGRTWLKRLTGEHDAATVMRNIGVDFSAYCLGPFPALSERQQFGHAGAQFAAQHVGRMHLVFRPFAPQVRAGAVGRAAVSRV